ncbi:hypothetical protein D9619_009062 [Psilocybe cf. subviscida]|uniref:Uncharacterized protein n=1 Tax=Psilocybe cf. subviscida TaxID=2480587 RepID=A0A8H5FAA5_9AGAR|nr:hypothetical protein D9619_009062 [Psilocybe cf. subviscida]
MSDMGGGDAQPILLSQTIAGMPNITCGRRKLGPIPPEGLADLKKYLDETFTEVNITSKDDKIMSLPMPWLTTLYRMFHPGRPGSIYDGRGWNDLFAETPKYPKFVWRPIHSLRYLADEFRLNEDYTFRLWLCQPGLLHVEVDDNGTWTAREILTLPFWMRLG